MDLRSHHPRSRSVSLRETAETDVQINGQKLTKEVL
jgi:hypothetical protein